MNYSANLLTDSILVKTEFSNIYDKTPIKMKGGKVRDLTVCM